MGKITISIKTPGVLHDLRLFVVFLNRYLYVRGYSLFEKFEYFKDIIVDFLYKKRGKYARPFLHFGTLVLFFVVITFGPLVFKQTEGEADEQAGQTVLSAKSALASDFYTLQAEEVKKYRGGEEIVHTVQEGETLSSIAERYALDESTIRWENDLDKNPKLKPGQKLTILPIDGIRHKVARGETIYSIGKKYDLDESQVQVIVDYPFNEFLNDETFELASGQYLMVPGGVKNDEPIKPRQPFLAQTPNAGSVTATGSFVWPAAGRITQGYSFYHKAIDIANGGGGPILAADAGVVTVAGWVDNSGYGRRVIINHSNGYSTLYAHMNSTQVVPGQTVNKGDVLGQMGSTGRSTGTHLHFEIRQGGVFYNPLTFLR